MDKFISIDNVFVNTKYIKSMTCRSLECLLVMANTETVSVSNGHAYNQTETKNDQIYTYPIGSVGYGNLQKLIERARIRNL